MNKEVIISDGTLDAWYSVVSGEKEWSDTHIHNIPDIRESLLRSIDYIRELRKELDKYEALGKLGHDVDEFYKETENTLYDYQNEESITESCDLYVLSYPMIEGNRHNPKTCHGKNFHSCYSCLRRI